MHCPGDLKETLQYTARLTSLMFKSQTLLMLLARADRGPQLELKFTVTPALEAVFREVIDFLLWEPLKSFLPGYKKMSPAEMRVRLERFARVYPTGIIFFL